VSAIATSFPDVFNQSPDLAAKATLTGNPVRPAVVRRCCHTIFCAGRSVAAPDLRRQPGCAGDGRCRSSRDRATRSGTARAAFNYPAGAQGGFEPRARHLRKALGQRRDRAVFADLPARIAVSHLIVSRSGASTVAELAAIGRPSILVPLPHALDQDQFANAGVLERAGGAIRLVQDDLRRAGSAPKSPRWRQRRKTSQKWPVRPNP